MNTWTEPSSVYAQFMLNATWIILIDQAKTPQSQFSNYEPWNWNITTRNWGFILNYGWTVKVPCACSFFLHLCERSSCNCLKESYVCSCETGWTIVKSDNRLQHVEICNKPLHGALYKLKLIISTPSSLSYITRLILDVISWLKSQIKVTCRLAGEISNARS